MVVLDKLPIWAVYLLTVVLVLVAAEIGFRVGMWLQRRDPDSKGSPVTGTVVGGLLGLMAFLLAFSIGIVINQQNGRKIMVVTEANAVGTAWLRAGFLDEPDGTISRDLLQEYVEVRLATAADATLFESAMSRSEEIHSQLWSIVEETVSQGQDSAIMALYADSINEVIDVHSERLFAVDLRLPRLLGMVLYAATVLSFLLVGIANSGDGKRDFVAIFLFALALVAVLDHHRRSRPAPTGYAHRQPDSDGGCTAKHGCARALSVGVPEPQSVVGPLGSRPRRFQEPPGPF